MMELQMRAPWMFLLESDRSELTKQSYKSVLYRKSADFINANVFRIVIIIITTITIDIIVYLYRQAVTASTRTPSRTACSYHCIAQDIIFLPKAQHLTAYIRGFKYRPSLKKQSTGPSYLILCYRATNLDEMHNSADRIQNLYTECLL